MVNTDKEGDVAGSDANVVVAPETDADGAAAAPPPVKTLNETHRAKLKKVAEFIPFLQNFADQIDEVTTDVELEALHASMNEALLSGSAHVISGDA